MNHRSSMAARRHFLQRIGLGSAAAMIPGAFAEALTLTPKMTEGPFYPDRLPLDTDNDLLVVNDALTPAVGEVTHLGGRVLDRNGNPLRNVVVEIWQVDNQGVYLHSGSAGAERRDTNFQGFGRFLTNVKGEYYFRTIKPRPYPGRTPHIHVQVRRGDQELLTTQLFVKGEPQNDTDGIVQRIRDPEARAAVLVDFRPLEGSPAGELQAHFDMVLGLTPPDVD
jgi:protocatechuate 3,4-dioxygenase, beta subunit